MISNLRANSIQKNKAIVPAMDYHFLREKAIDLITKLSGHIWTDHNSHDPGITIMELICYALTDLSYRTNFPINDLMAISEEEKTSWANKYPPAHPKSSYNDLEKLGLFEAHKILPTHPLTINDYRKLLLKIEGVRNAWLVPHCGSAETKIYADCENSKLTFSTFQYEFKTGVYKGQSIIFKFPKKNKYANLFRLFENLQIDNLNHKGNLVHLILKFKIRNKTIKEKASVEFIIPKRPNNIAAINNLETAVKNLFDPNSEETLWDDFWIYQRAIYRKKLKEIKLNGLYNVLLELEVDPEMGPLTERKLHYKIPYGELKGTAISFDLNTTLPAFPELNTIESVDSINLSANNKNIWDIKMKLKINDESLEIPNAKLHLLRGIPDIISSKNTPINIKKTAIRDALGDEVLNPQNSILSTYWRKQLKINKTIKTVCCVLDAHRNLCEDFWNVDLVEPQQLGICMDIETRNSADLELLSAQINLVIENYYNPPIKHYTLKELLDEGFTANEIFDGPFIDYSFKCSNKPEDSVFTKPGFIKIENLENAELKNTLFTSDIINILMDFDNVLAVKNVMLRKFNAFGEPSNEPSEKWCLNIPIGKQAVHNISLSKIVFFKDEIPYTAKLTETEETLKYLRAKSKKDAYVSVDQSFIINKGTFRELDAFQALQHDLPDIYGTSPMKLPTTVSSKRLNDAKNLKAYLLFFEQIFADYLQQLYHSKWLLSPESIDQSYFSKFLQSEDISPLSAPSFEDEYYYDKTPGNPYLKDPKTRQLLYERDQEFVERRNSMLDHLLARFAESFTDYTLMLFDMEGERVSAGKDLIIDKTSFLEGYPKLSRERGKAFNYRPAQTNMLWDTDNVSGLEKRSGLLMGIQNLQRRFLHCDLVESLMLRAQKVVGVDSFFIKCCDNKNKTLFNSKERFGTRDEANLHISKIREGLNNISKYSFNSEQRLVLKIGSALISSENIFDSFSDYEELLDNIFISYHNLLQDERFCGSESNEGMYVIEHILLRPLVDGFQNTLMEVCLPKNCEYCPSEDPYSFRLSIILPYWPGRFNSPDFRRHFEKTIRLETPSHIMLKLCWIDNEQMKRLGLVYKAWLKLRANKKIDTEKYNKSLAKLISVLKELRNIYPHATLHDCEEDGGDNPVHLGHTSLGSF